LLVLALLVMTLPVHHMIPTSFPDDILCTEGH